MTDAGEPPAVERKPGEPRTAAKFTFWLLAVATLAAIAAAIVRLRPDPGLWISLIVVWLVFWLALWLVAFVSKEPSAKDIGVALLTGLVLAGAAFVLNFVLEEALASRDRERRESETKLAINRRAQFVFRSEDFRDFDLRGMALISTDEARFDLSFTDLTGADLSQAELRRVLMRHAILVDANLSEADLAQANLRQAELLGATFASANLSGADLTGASDLDEGSTEGGFAVLSENTVCPDGERADFFAAENRYSCSAADQGTPLRARQLFLVSRGAATGAVVGRVIATDLDADALTYGATGMADDAFFAVDPRTGVITVARTLEEAEPRTELQVTVTDGINDPLPIRVIIAIEDDNSPPVPEVSYLVRDDSPVGTRIGRIEEPEEWQGDRTFAIDAGDSSGLFELDERTGILTLNGKPQAGASYVLNVRIGEADRISTTLPVRITVISQNAPPRVLTTQPLEAFGGGAPGDRVATVEAEDPDGDAVDFAIAAVQPSGDHFEIDPATGSLTVGRQPPPVGEYTLTLQLTDDGIPARSVEAKVTVRVLQAVAQAVPHRFLVPNGGTLAVPAEDGLLTEEQRAAGVTTELTVSPSAGRLQGSELLPSGGFTYTHVTEGFGPDRFAYRTVDAAGTQSEAAEVTLAVVVTEPGEFTTTSEAGVAAARLEVKGLAADLVDVAVASGNTQVLELQPAGAIVSLIPGDQLFEIAPWHRLELLVTDREAERSLTVTLVVAVDYVVASGDSLAAVAAQVLEAAAASGAPCPDSTAAYAARIDEASGVGPLDPGDVLVLPDCRPGG